MGASVSDALDKALLAKAVSAKAKRGSLESVAGSPPPPSSRDLKIVNSYYIQKNVGMLKKFCVRRIKNIVSNNKFYFADYQLQ